MGRRSHNFRPFQRAGMGVMRPIMKQIPSVYAAEGPFSLQ